MVARSLYRLVLLLLLLAAPAAAVAEQPPMRVYTTADGLASDVAFRIRMDSRGFLWFCTTEGVSRFDGYAFANYTTHDGLADRRVSDVAETSDGRVWVGTASGLCRLEARGQAGAPLFAVERLGDDPKANDVNALLAAPDGALWCGTEAGLFRLERSGDGWLASRVDLGAADGVTALAEDRWGGVLVGSAGALRLLEQDGRVRTESLVDVLGGACNVDTIYADRDGTLWVGSRCGIARSAPRASADAPIVMSNATSGPIARSWGNAFLRSRDGALLLALTPGLWREADGTYVRRTAIESACDRGVLDLLEDRDGNLWLATECGVLRIDRFGFTGYTKADGLVPSDVNSIFEDNAGDLIVTSRRLEPVLHRLEESAFTSVTPNLAKANYYGWGWGQTEIQDHEGAWWAPSAAGLFRYPQADRPEAAVRSQPETIYAGHEVFRVYEDSRGDVWFATVGPPGLLRWDRAGERVVDVTGETGMGAAAEYTAFAETRDGAVWVGTNNRGLLRYKDGRFVRLAGEDGVPAGWLRSLYVDDAGRLWIASSLGGLGRVDAPEAERPSVSVYTMTDGLASDNVWSVVSDAWGRIYAGTPHGVDRIDPGTGRVKHFTTADGLPKGQPLVAYRDRRGSLWFGTVFGLARLDPEPEREREPPRALVTGVRVAGVARPVSALGEAAPPAFEVGPGESSVSVEFVGLGARLGEALRYQYRLEGSDADWSPPSPERAVTLANLSPGSYRLLVRAVDADGLASPGPAVVAFRVLAPVWQRPWFLALAAGLVGLGAYGLYRYRVRRLVEVERVRTRIATDLHDDIGSNLTRIAILSEVAQYRLADEPASAGDPLASIASISRDSVASMSDIVWAINPKKDSLDDLVRRMRRLADEAFASRGVALEFRGPEHERGLRLGLETRRQIFLVFKEAVNNAVRHSGASRADVEVRAARGHLTVVVADDGRGFDPAADGEGNGLESMRRRAAALGGTFEVDAAPGRGTRVTLSVPLGAGRRRERPVHMDR